MRLVPIRTKRVGSFRGVIIKTAVAFVLCSGGMLPASSQDALPSSDVAGTWRGPWYLGMTSGIATLRLEMQGAKWAGTLQMTNNENFGDQALPLRDLATEGEQLVFKATGEDGRTLSAALPRVPGNAAAMKGMARYGGFKLRFELSRVSAP